MIIFSKNLSTILLALMIIPGAIAAAANDQCGVLEPTLPQLTQELRQATRAVIQLHLKIQKREALEGSLYSQQIASLQENFVKQGFTPKQFKSIYSQLFNEKSKSARIQDQDQIVQDSRRDKIIEEQVKNLALAERHPAIQAAIAKDLKMDPDDVTTQDLMRVQRIVIDRDPSLLRLTHKDLRGLKSLHTLEINFSPLEAIDNDAFGDLESLKNLTIKKHNLKSIEAHTFTSLKIIESIWITYGPLSAIDKTNFVDKTRLRSLNLSGNKLSSLTPGIFQNLTGLEDLSFYGNKLTNMDEVKNLNTLKKLNIGGNPLGHLEASLLVDLTNLEHFAAEATNLTELNKDLFTHNPNLTSVYLNYNSLVTIDKDTFLHNRISSLQIANNRLDDESKGWISKKFGFRARLDL